MKKIALVTGCSTGLGIDIAVALSKADFEVYATMRNLDKRGALDTAAADEQLQLKVMHLDVQDTSSVEKCVADILTAHGKIDLLVNNAGAGFVRSTEQASEDEIKWVLDVNFVGVVRCTKAVIPHMREARSGHIINVSSVGGLVGQPFNELYCAAKFAVEGYTEALASYVQPAFNVHFTVVEPGGISTEFANNALAQLGSTGGMREDAYLPILQRYIGGARGRNDGPNPAHQSGEAVARVIVECAKQSDPPIRLRTSAWGEELCKFKTSADPDGKLQQASVIEQFLGDMSEQS